MKYPQLFPSRWLRVAGIVVATLTLTGSFLVSVRADESKKSGSAPKKLTGAELYAINCNRCHPERYPTEFKTGQWQTLMLHMRVRASLPAKQAKVILKYLQEESGN